MSWVIRDRVTGQAVAETFTKEFAEVVNAHSKNFEAVPILQHLQELNTEGTNACAWAARAERTIH